MPTYSNPRMRVEIPDWPSGKKRVTAIFEIETDPKSGKQRATRTTTGAPKKLTYAQQARIVDGDDGRTYILELSMYGHITVMQGTMQYEQETIFKRDPRYPSVRALFEQK